MNACIISTYAVGSNGYPRKNNAKGVPIHHHRLVYAEVHGLNMDTDMKGLVVMHTCDNPRCINPDHLRLGTQQENIDDMHAKGRQYTGKRGVLPGATNPAAKLTEEQVIEIYTDKRSSQKELAAKFGVTKSLVQKIQYNIGWTHVTSKLPER